MAAPRTQPPVQAEASLHDTPPLQALLQQTTRVMGAAPAPGQIVLGRLTRLPLAGQNGQAEVAALGAVMVTHSLVPLGPEQLEAEVALSLLADGSALVLGPLWQACLPKAADVPPTEQGLVVTVDGHREVIEAAQELELRCGEACIVLTADGRIQLRGTYITSHASATQRIVGGSVHVN